VCRTVYVKRSYSFRCRAVLEQSNVKLPLSKLWRYMGKRRYNSHILNLNTRRGGLVSFTPREHYPREKRPRYSGTGRWTLRRREKSLTTTENRTTTHI